MRTRKCSSKSTSTTVCLLNSSRIFVSLLKHSRDLSSFPLRGFHCTGSLQFHLQILLESWKVFQSLLEFLTSQMLGAVRFAVFRFSRVEVKYGQSPRFFQNLLECCGVFTTYLTESVHTDVLQKSIPTRIHQFILCYHSSEQQLVEFARELTFAGRR